MNDTTPPILTTGDYVIFKNKKYRFMYVRDWSDMPPLQGLTLLVRNQKPVTLQHITPQIVDFEEVDNTANTVSDDIIAIVWPTKAENLIVNSRENRSFSWISVVTPTVKGYMEYQCVEEYADNSGTSSSSGTSDTSWLRANSSSSSSGSSGSGG